MVLKRFVLPSSGPSPYYMIILFPSGNTACVKYIYKHSNWEQNAVYIHRKREKERRQQNTNFMFPHLFGFSVTVQF